MVLHVHRAERADVLVEALRSLLADPLPDPFAPEVVSVPTRGMERWLTQRISDRLGVCANVEFPYPRRLVGDAVATAAGVDPDTDPWLPEHAVWPLLEVVDASLAEPWLDVLAAHLRADPARRFAAVRHLAELFDRYALHRPEMVRAWAGDRGGHWQAELWRRLRARIARPGPAERVEHACGHLRDDPRVVGLPRRLSLFGLTRLPAGHLAVLRALAAHRDVHLFLLHPSPALWERIAPAPPIVRRDDDTAPRPANRLLASWGRDARELQLVIGRDHEDHHHPTEHRAPTLLGRIQQDVRADRPPPAEHERPPHDPADRSIQVHACHGRARQVEVVRDAILHLLNEDPTLEPRDVIVMCPDIETFAPLIQATFGASEGEDDLRVRLADRSLRQTNPVLGVVAQLIDLAEQRLTASQVLDLASREPVRRRFGLDDEDLTRMQDWVAAGGIRWGLDAQHRAPFKLDALDAGTWRAGLDRVLLGVTMTEDARRLFAGVLPLDDVGSGAIDLAGRFAELVDRLRTALDSFGRPQPAASWAAAIAAAADALTATAENDAWQRAELERVLEEVAVGGETTLALAEVRALLGERLQGRPTRANFRTGHLTVCTLVPMRSIPHRVVCLLGLDDGVFPRKAPRDGDDLMLDDPHVGDRDARTEDRQLLLDALLAATDRLIVTYTGNDERTNVLRPPAVPVGELLDAVDRTVRGADVVVRHPLQPFDPRNFAAGAPWSFDQVALEGARAMTGPRAGPEPFLPGPLPAADAPLVELDDVVAFARHPVRAFLRRRLGIRISERSDEVEDSLPVELEGLERWGVGERLLRDRLAGADIETCVAAERARGTLPPGELAGPVVEQIRPVVEEIAAHGHVDAEPASVDVRVALAGRSLTGTVPEVCGNVLRTVTYSRVNAGHRIAAWVRLLALTVAYPGRRFEAVTVGRSEDGVTVVRIPPCEDPEQHLATLLDLFDRGMREPLPIASRASAAYAAEGAAAARGQWQSSWSFDREDREPEHRLVHGGVRTFAELLAEPPRADERWHPDETSRFGQYARRLWDGLLVCER